jgi:iron complex transport system substrate-binding protein
MVRSLPALALLAACASAPPAAEVRARPRLASFSPALTETLFSLGLGGQVVGVTRFCELPPGEERPVLGDAVTVSAEAVLAARPDVLLIQSRPERFTALRQLAPDLRVEHFTIETLADIAAAERRLGALAGEAAVGEAAAAAFTAEVEELRRRSAGLPRPRALFVTGSEQAGAAGRGTFADELLALAGAKNAAAGLTGWQTIDVEYALSVQPEVLVCWSPEADTARDLARWRGLADLPAAREGRVLGITGQSWLMPTPRLTERARDLLAMVHPEAVTP